jgi:hypothetical protein
LKKKKKNNWKGGKRNIKLEKFIRILKDAMGSLLNPTE